MADTKNESGPRADHKARRDVAAQRACLRCENPFQSEGFGERICPRCKGTAAWRASVPAGAGQGRRRSGGH